MSKKQYYIFNSQTNTYEPVKDTRRNWPFVIWVLFASSIMGAVLISVVYFFFGSPHDEYLKMENEQLQAKYNILSRRVDDAMVVLEDIEQRDRRKADDQRRKDHLHRELRRTRLG